MSAVQCRPDGAEHATEASGSNAHLRINHTDGIVTITDPNTTLGYCRYNDAGEIEYLFVHPAHRRRGHGMRLLRIVESHLLSSLVFQPPLSPLGRRLEQAYRDSPSQGQRGQQDGVRHGQGASPQPHGSLQPDLRPGHRSEHTGQPGHVQLPA